MRHYFKGSDVKPRRPMLNTSGSWIEYEVCTFSGCAPNLKGTFSHAVRVLRTWNDCDCLRTILNFEITASWFISDKLHSLASRNSVQWRLMFVVLSLAGLKEMESIAFESQFFSHVCWSCMDLCEGGKKCSVGDWWWLVKGIVRACSMYLVMTSAAAISTLEKD